METIDIIDRVSGTAAIEKVYHPEALRFLYGGTLSGQFLCALASKWPLPSWLYGLWMKRSGSKAMITPFIDAFDIDSSEFLEAPEQYVSFNDFFTRKLKADSRPMPDNEKDAIIPADGRYRFFQNIDKVDGFIVKGKKFSLDSLLGDEALAEKYQDGTMVLGRLCPSDYHRYHFPCACIPNEGKSISGALYSVNPIAVKRNIEIFTQNKRRVTKLQTKLFGEVLYIEVGATNVGSIIQTYQPQHPYERGEEKGYFSFGASALILLFEKGRMMLAPDLLKLSQQDLEIRCLMGQPLGTPR